MFFGKRKKNSEIRTDSLPAAVPCHLAIIMDGNGRWAKQRGLPRKLGHRAGADKLQEVCRDCCRLGIPNLSVYAFSTENWKRPDEEVRALMDLVIEFFAKYDQEMEKEGIRLRFLGDLSGLPAATLKTVREAEEKSRLRERLTLNVALNYGSRQEIIRAAELYAAAVQAGTVRPGSLDEAAMRRYFYDPEMPDPDLLIRPGGEKRLSNFLLWQLSYAELWFCDVLWPDFSSDDLLEALHAYAKRERRYGDVRSD